MKELKSQADFVEALYVNFVLSLKEFIANEKEGRTQEHYWQNKNYMNKNCGKYALKRKITLIRQELLNLEKMIERT